MFCVNLFGTLIPCQQSGALGHTISNDKQLHGKMFNSDKNLVFQFRSVLALIWLLKWLTYIEHIKGKTNEYLLSDQLTNLTIISSNRSCVIKISLSEFIHTLGRYASPGYNFHVSPFWHWKPSMTNSHTCTRKFVIKCMKCFKRPPIFHNFPRMYTRRILKLGVYMLSHYYMWQTDRFEFEFSLIELHSSLWNVAPQRWGEKCYILKTATILSFDHISSV